MSVVTAHTVYFCAYVRSEIFQKSARELGVDCRQFYARINELTFTEVREIRVGEKKVSSIKLLVI